MSAKSDIPALLAHLMAKAPAGFALGLHMRYTTPTYMFQTYPPAWLEEYSREGLLMRDPLIAWAFANRGVTTWSALEANDEPGGVLERAKNHGMNYGLAVSIEREGSHSLGGFARQDREFTPDEVESIQAAMSDLHDATAKGTGLSAKTRDGLRRLSVAFTHP